MSSPDLQPSITYNRVIFLYNCLLGSMSSSVIIPSVTKPDR
jgi:hypothetical protein